MANKEKDAKIKADTPIHFAAPTKSKSQNTNEFNCFYIFYILAEKPQILDPISPNTLLPEGVLRLSTSATSIHLNRTPLLFKMN